MATSSENSLGTTVTPILRNSSSNEDLQELMNERKRKRMQSNRESARRSRMRKQKHLDELTAQVAALRQDNGQIINAVNLTTQQLLTVEAENTVLRARLGELTTRLNSLNEMYILKYMSSGGPAEAAAAAEEVAGFDGVMGNQWCVNQPLMASPDYHLFGC